MIKSLASKELSHLSSAPRLDRNEDRGVHFTEETRVLECRNLHH
jgi:hypothetical protein